MNLTGGCLCGAIRYEAKVSASENWYCHCRMCQKSTGSVVSISWLKIENDLKRKHTQKDDYE